MTTAPTSTNRKGNRKYILHLNPDIVEAVRLARDLGSRQMGEHINRLLEKDLQRLREYF